MDILTYDIYYNSHTGYYQIVDSKGKSYGEYLKYEDAEEDLNNGTFDNSEESKLKEEDDKEYVVCRKYYSKGQNYVMFTRGRLSDHVSYPDTSTTYRSGFNDTSIKIYNNKEKAKAVARQFNEISKQKKYYKYANWKAVEKWW